VPQAWAAGSVFTLLQALIGFDADAPRGKLYIDPMLPDWLPDLHMVDFRLGKRVFDLRFWRDGAETRFEVVKGDERMVERRSLAAAALARAPEAV
jgi:hypothetical protein